MIHVICPHCGEDLERPAPAISVDLAKETAVVKGTLLYLMPKTTIILNALVKAAPDHVKTKTLIWLVWGDDYTPNDPENALRVHMSALRKQLKDVGLQIDSRQWHGYRLVMS